MDDIIDVRSPDEYAEDHIPGALNLPVLDNEQRARVGTIYVRESRFRARKIGAALIARNIASHLETTLSDRPAGYQPLVYCWRGGQRSGAMATILSQIGWRVWLLEGGWQAYRRAVVAALYDGPWRWPLVILDGYTGTAKTDVLAALSARSVQTVDLEGLANHRGSLFGGFAEAPQPPQKMFESRLLAAFQACDPRHPVVVEAESPKIGRRTLPPSLWSAMQQAPRVRIGAPVAARAAYSVRRYADIIADPARLQEVLGYMVRLRGRQQVATWQALAQAGQLQQLAEELIAQHYDPAYRRSRDAFKGALLGEVTAPSLDPADLEGAADALARLISDAPKVQTLTPETPTPEALAPPRGSGLTAFALGPERRRRRR